MRVLPVWCCDAVGNVDGDGANPCGFRLCAQRTRSGGDVCAAAPLVGPTWCRGSLRYLGSATSQSEVSGMFGCLKVTAGKFVDSSDFHTST